MSAGNSSMGMNLSLSAVASVVADCSVVAGSATAVTASSVALALGLRPRFLGAASFTPSSEGVVSWLSALYLL